LIVPGTGTPKAEDVADYMQNAYNRYVAASNPELPPTCTFAACTLDGVDYPASFWPLVFIPGWCVSGRCEKWNVSVEEGVEQLDEQLTDALADSDNDKIVLFGYSQGARVVSIEKENLADNPNKDKLEIVLIGNISRPNGGLWSRLSFLPTIPIFDVSFGNPTPTDTGIKTTDISFEYDGVSDFPVYPLNLLAVANAIAGFQYVHGYYLVPNGNGPTDQLPWGYTPEDIQGFIEAGDNPTKGDTTYVTIPAKSLPILQPFIDFGNATGTSSIVNPILELVQPALKVLIDIGYDRTANPGDPMTFRLIPIINPFKLAVDLVVAVGQGIKDATDGVPIVPTVTPPPTSSTTTEAPAGGPSPFSTFTRSGPETPSNDAFTPAPSNDNSVVVSTLKTDPKPVVNTDTQLPADNSGQTTAADNGSVVKPFQLLELPKPGTSSTTQPKKPNAWKPGAVLQRVTTGLEDAINGLMKPHGDTDTDDGNTDDGDTGDGAASTSSPGQAAA
jgi:hypothetical protein